MTAIIPLFQRKCTLPKYVLLTAVVQGRLPLYIHLGGALQERHKKGACRRPFLVHRPSKLNCTAYTCMISFSLALAISSIFLISSSVSFCI
jgi:hypothetical protein